MVTRHRALAATMIGRQTHLRQCEEALQLARGGAGQVVLIAGEAGIGKSRLVREFLKRARAQGELTVLEGHCYDEEPAVPYGPFMDAVRSLVRAAGADAVVTAAGPLAADLARLLPELAPPAPAPPAADDPQAQKRRLFEAIRAVCCPAAERAVRLIVLEDLHWVDRTSGELIVYLERMIARERVLLLGTYRADEAAVQPPLTRLLVELNRERRAGEIRLDPLTRDELAAMLETILRRQLPDGFIEALYDRTGGNPFFAEEILKSLLETGALDRLIDQTRRGHAVDLAALPLSVRDSIRRRAGGLDPPSVAVLRYAAVLGRRFDCALLLALTGCDEAELLRRLRALVAAQLIVEESADAFAFRHALTHQAVYGDLLARERRVLHGEVAAMLERLYAASLDAHLAELAYHTYQAGAWERALRYARRAGEQARDLAPPRAAVEQFTRALDAAGRAAPVPPPARTVHPRARRGRATGAAAGGRPRGPLSRPWPGPRTPGRLRGSARRLRAGGPIGRYRRGSAGRVARDPGPRSAVGGPGLCPGRRLVPAGAGPGPRAGRAGAPGS